MGVSFGAGGPVPLDPCLAIVVTGGIPIERVFFQITHGGESPGLADGAATLQKQGNGFGIVRPGFCALAGEMLQSTQAKRHRGFSQNVAHLTVLGARSFIGFPGDPSIAQIQFLLGPCHQGFGELPVSIRNIRG